MVDQLSNSSDTVETVAAVAGGDKLTVVANWVASSWDGSSMYPSKSNP